MRRILISLTALALLVAPQLAFGADVDDLKAAHLRLMQALNTKDIDYIMAAFHPEAVGFNRYDGFGADLKDAPKEAWQQFWQQWKTNMEYLRSTPINMQYRVHGNTGIAWGNSRSVSKSKDGPEVTENNRGTATYLKTGGKWLAVSYHISAVP